MAYDSYRQRSVMFGGVIPNDVSGETWEWDGTSWTVPTTAGPSPREIASLVYDSSRRVCVLFGGNGLEPPYFHNDTWEWDGLTWSLRASGGPAPRAGQAMAFDSARNVTVMYGGVTGDGIAGRNSDTWEWNGSDWIERNVSGPGRRTAHGMAYDSNRRVTVLFGGYSEGNQANTDTWEWDGNVWTQRAIGGPAPNSGPYPAIAFDANRGVTVVLDSFGYTWEWNGTVWARRFIAGPRNRTGASMAYDSSRKVCVLFGGHTPYPASTETWEIGSGPCISVATQPGAATVCTGNTVSFSIAVTSTSAVTYMWRRNSLPIDSVANPSAATSSLVLSAVPIAEAGLFDCVASNECGSATSATVSLSVHAPCPADLDDGSGFGNADCGTDVSDLLFFLSAFESGNVANADLDNGSGNGVPDNGVDISDLLFFVDHFEAGC